MIRVLIADDHAVVRDGLGALLEAHAEITVLAGVPDGREAVAQAKKLAPDVAILDISMPELDGIEAAGQIQAAAPRTGVIILSMAGTPGQIARALQAGARGYLLKESAGREVIQAVLSVSAGQFYFSQPVLAALVGDYLRLQNHQVEVDPLEPLSQREREVLLWVVQGKTSAEIAEILFLSPKTVESYRSRMMHKLDLPDLPGLMKFALQHGLIS